MSNRKRFNRMVIGSSELFEVKRHSHELYIQECHNKNIKEVENIPQSENKPNELLSFERGLKFQLNRYRNECQSKYQTTGRRYCAY